MNRLLLPVFLLSLLVAHPAAFADIPKGREAAIQGGTTAAIRKWKPLAEQGFADAQYKLGVIYQDGLGAPQDYREAAKWYRLAAEQGYAAAQINLGVMYDNGQEIPQDYAEAIKWYRLAAEQGNAFAQGRLGLLYYFGEGVAEDHISAHMWWNIAASQGEEKARKSLVLVEKIMTPGEISEARKSARKWMEKHGGK